jgi:hypothetical protein
MTLATTCPKCHGDTYTEHDVSRGDYCEAVAWPCRACAEQGTVWTFEQGPPPSDDVLVMFEGEPTAWGEMTCQDRKAFLEGGCYGL